MTNTITGQAERCRYDSPAEQVAAGNTGIPLCLPFHAWCPASQSLSLGFVAMRTIRTVAGVSIVGCEVVRH